MTTAPNDAVANRNSPPILRIAAKINRRGPDECWPWTGPLSPKGDGRPRVSSGGKQWLASRLLYTIVHGPLPRGLGICHHCDNPSCMNMRHWFVGTQRENVADMQRKGRRARIIGTRNPLAKMTDSLVAEMRARHAAGESMSALARWAGVSRITASMVIRRKSWSHVP